MWSLGWTDEFSQDSRNPSHTISRRTSPSQHLTHDIIADDIAVLVNMHIAE